MILKYIFNNIIKKKKQSFNSWIIVIHQIPFKNGLETTYHNRERALPPSRLRLPIITLEISDLRVFTIDTR